jgi:hypothetical protein
VGRGRGQVLPRRRPGVPDHLRHRHRWHITDPIRFERAIRVTVQALGWRYGHDYRPTRYLTRQDDLASVAFWNQTLPGAPFPALPGRDALELI